jgi:NAD(P)H-dependent FMN reductase
MQKILVILGTTRPTRLGTKVADWFMEATKQHPEMEYEFVDLVDTDLPLLNEPELASTGKYTYDYTKRWSEKVKSADSFILITPEYNHSYSAALKNALDYLYHEWAKKPVAFVGYGGHYGLRSVEHLRHVVIQLQMVPLNEQVEINHFVQIDENGVFHATEQNERQAKNLLKSLQWWSEVLSAARNKKED